MEQKLSEKEAIKFTRTPFSEMCVYDEFVTLVFSSVFSYISGPISIINQISWLIRFYLVNIFLVL